MRIPIAATFALLLSTSVAGCLASSGTGQSAPVDPVPLMATGAIQGLVLDDEARPLEGVNVTLVEAQATVASGIGGDFLFEGVPVGDHEIVASLAFYEDAIQEVTVLADLTVQVRLTLVKLPEYRPFNLTTILQGHYDCVAEYLIITGDCGIAYETVTCLTGYCSSDPLFSEKYQFPFLVEPRWESIVAEMTWTEGNENQLDGMRLYIEHKNESSADAGHAVKVGRADDNVQPMALRIERGVPHKSADVYPGTKTKAFIPDEGGPQQIRVFPKGHLWETTRTICDSNGRCFLGVGAGLDIDFTIYLTIFYNAPAPLGFTAIPAA